MSVHPRYASLGPGVPEGIGQVNPDVALSTVRLWDDVTQKRTRMSLFFSSNSADTARVAQAISTGRCRATGYFVLPLLALLIFLPLRNLQSASGAQIHTLLELAATRMALLAGILALVRYHSRKSNTFLFLGCGFLAAGLLDGYHAMMSSTLMA